MTLDTAPKFGWRPRALIGHLIALRHHDVTAKRLSDMKNCDTGCLFFFTLRRQMLSIELHQEQSTSDHLKMSISETSAQVFMDYEDWGLKFS